MEVSNQTTLKTALKKGAIGAPPRVPIDSNHKGNPASAKKRSGAIPF